MSHNLVFTRGSRPHTVASMGPDVWSGNNRADLSDTFGRFRHGGIDRFRYDDRYLTDKRPFVEECVVVQETHQEDELAREDAHNRVAVSHIGSGERDRPEYLDPDKSKAHTQ